MFNYFEVNDAVKIRVNFACEKEGLETVLVSKFSPRSAENHLYKVLCYKENEYIVYDFNATTHLLYNKVAFDNCKDALTFIGNKYI